MNRGYHLPRPDRGATDPWAGFEWRIGETYNIGAVALASAETDPAATALRHLPLDEPPTRLSYGELKEATDAVAAGLRDRGVERGDRVAVCLPQCPELLLAHLAIFELGAVSVPLSMLLGADSFRYSLDDSETTLAVVDAVRAGEVGPLDVETLSVDPGGYADSPLGGFRDAVHRGATVEPVSTAPDDPALVLYTSGTTGEAEGRGPGPFVPRRRTPRLPGLVRTVRRRCGAIGPRLDPGRVGVGRRALRRRVPRARDGRDARFTGAPVGVRPDRGSPSSPRSP